MRYNLLRAASLAGKDYKKGIHSLPDEAVKDPFFSVLSKFGLIFEIVEAKAPAIPVVDEKAPVVPVPSDEKHKRGRKKKEEAQEEANSEESEETAAE